jgi:hypothetical protein
LEPDDGIDDEDVEDGTDGVEYTIRSDGLDELLVVTTVGVVPEIVCDCTKPTSPHPEFVPTVVVDEDPPEGGVEYDGVELDEEEPFDVPLDEELDTGLVGVDV